MEKETYTMAKPAMKAEGEPSHCASIMRHLADLYQELHDASGGSTVAAIVAQIKSTLQYAKEEGCLNGVLN
jgi:hypothetical protein